jgi:hypothetical protein
VYYKYIPALWGGSEDILDWADVFECVSEIFSISICMPGEDGDRELGKAN